MAKNMSIRFSAASSAAAISSTSLSTPSVPPDELQVNGPGGIVCPDATSTTAAPAQTSSVASSSRESSPVTVHSTSSADIDIIQSVSEEKGKSDSTTDNAVRTNGHDLVTVVSRSPSSGSTTTTTTTMFSNMSNKSSTTTATSKESPDKFDEPTTITSTPVGTTPHQQASAVVNKNSASSNRSSNKSSPTVGSKVDRFVRQLQESFSSSSSKVETPTATTTWCKFAKAGEGGVASDADALEIISGVSQTAESMDDSLARERVSITLTPAAAVSPFASSNQANTTVTTSNNNKSSSAASVAYNSWLADMKMFKEKWSKVEKSATDKKVVVSGGEEPKESTFTTPLSSCSVSSSSSTSSSSSSTQVTVSNAYLNNNYYLVNSGGNHVCGMSSTTCSLCSASRGTAAIKENVQAPSTLPVQSSFGGTVYCAICLTTTNDHQHHQIHQQTSKCNAINSNATPQRTPTPPLLVSPNEVVFDPNFDPYLAGETSTSSNNMAFFSFGKEKKDKKEKEKEKESKPNRAKLFIGSSSSQSKEKDANAVAAAAAKKKSKEKDKEREKEKDKDTSNNFFTKIITSRSSSVSTPSSSNISSSNLSTFLSGHNSAINKNNTSPSQSRYSSNENISMNNSNDNSTNWSAVAKTSVNSKTSKSSNSSSNSSSRLSSSRSMISFRKLNNGENESEVTFDDLDISSIQDTRQSFYPQPTNPTLRRKAESFRRTDSPTTTELLSGQTYDGDTMSLASSKSSNSNNSSASTSFQRNHSKSISTADLSCLNSTSDLQQASAPQSPTARQRLSQLSTAVLPSSWATCIAYVYYIFALVVGLLSLLISLISPLPAFFNGLVLGFVCTFLIITVVIIYIVSHYILVKSPSLSEEEAEAQALRKQSIEYPISLKRSFNRPKLSTNSLYTTPTTLSEPDLYSGWVYEFIGEYEEREKNGFLSQLVHVVLRGTRLTVYTPAVELNEKKLKALLAAENAGNNNNNSSSSKAQQGSVTFASQRIIEFTRQSRKPRVTLLLTKNVRNQRKYVWSKKYPVCLEFGDDRTSNGGGYIVVGKSNDDRGSSSSSNESSSSLQEAATGISVVPAPTLTQTASTSSFTTPSPVPLKLVLFARSCREKEEWFWAMKTAVDMAYKGSGSTDVSPKSSNLNIADSTIVTSTSETPQADVNLDFSNSTQQYLRILTRRINYGAFMRANVLSGSDGPNMHQSPLNWFNVLLNRLSFDILNKPNWSAYIAKKLQRKLRKLRLPYFMESLTITEIDIGTTLPKFNSVPSTPVVDDAGLWIDFDVSYSGKR